MAISSKRFTDIYNMVSTFLESNMDYSEFYTFCADRNEDDWYSLDESSFCHTVGFQEISLYNGASKGVIVSDELEYVVKIPFAARYSGKIADYCKFEYENYCEAKKAKLDNFFAETIFLGEILGVPVYLQEKLDCDEERLSNTHYNLAYNEYCKLFELNTSAAETVEKFQEYYEEEFYSTGVDGDSSMLDLFRLTHSPEEVYAFDNFCNKHCINDLHMGNFGYRGYEIIAIDFSGYGEKAVAFHQTKKQPLPKNGRG